MKSRQSGFSVVEILIVIVVAGVLGAAGWFVMGRSNNKKTETASNATTVSSQNGQDAGTSKESALFTDCHTEAGKVVSTTASGMMVYEWKTIEHAAVVLSDWNVMLTLPQDVVGKAVCRFTGSNYEFSTKAVVTNEQCVYRYRYDELSSEGVQVSKYSATEPANGQVFGAQGTLDDYYNANKVANGNYFTDPGAGRNYYKVGDAFYIAFGDAKGIYEKYKAARTAACTVEKPDFMQPFVDALATIKQR